MARRAERGGARPKKLRQAAVVWARAIIGDDDRSRSAAFDDELAAQFASMGARLPDEAIEEEQDFEVAPENVEVLLLFLKLRTQWCFERSEKRLFWTGLDYAAVDALLRLTVAKRKKRMRLFEVLREMESAALPVLNGGPPLKGDEPWH